MYSYYLLYACPLKTHHSTAQPTTAQLCSTAQEKRSAEPRVEKCKRSLCSACSTACPQRNLDSQASVILLVLATLGRFRLGTVVPIYIG